MSQDYTSTNNNAELLRADLNRIREGSEYATTYHELAKDHLAAYKILQDKGADWPYPHDVKTSDTFSLVEDYTAKMVSAFTSVEPIIAIKKKRGIDPVSTKLAEQLETVLQSMFQYPEGRFHEEFENFCRQSAIHGTGFFSITPVLLPSGRLDYIRFETMDYWSVFPDSRATSIERSHYLLVRRLIPRNFLFANPQLFPEIEAKPKEITEALFTSVNEDAHKALLAEIGLEPYTATDESTDLVELFYVFQNGDVRIIANRKIYVANQRQDAMTNPFIYGIPVEEFAFIPQVKEFFSPGIPYVVSGLQQYRDALRSMRLTNVDLALNAPMKIRVGSEIDPYNFSVFPGAVIPVIEPDDIVPFVFPDATSSSYREDAIIQTDMEQATALHKASRGNSESKRQTGTEVLRLQQAASARIDIQTKRMEKVLQRIARRCIAYIHEFMDPVEYNALIGDQDAGFFTTPLRHFLRYWHQLPVGAAVSSIKEIRIKRQMQAYQLLTSIPPEVTTKNLNGQAGFMVDIKKVVKDLLIAGDIPNPDAYIVDIAPPQQQQAQPQAQQPQQPAQALQDEPDMRAIIANLTQGGEQ